MFLYRKSLNTGIEVYKTIGSTGAVFPVQEVVPGLQEISWCRGQSTKDSHEATCVVLANAPGLPAKPLPPPRGATLASGSLMASGLAPPPPESPLGKGVSRFPLSAQKAAEMLRR